MAPSRDAPEITWAAEMPLLTNRFFLYDGAKLFLWLAVILGAMVPVLAAVAGTLRQVLPLLRMFGWMVAGPLYLFVFIAWVIFRNRYPMAFRVGPKGIAWCSLSRTGLVANRVALVTGAVTGNIGEAGGCLLAISQESGGLPWRKLRNVRKHPDERVITLMNSWRVVARLYCTPLNYCEVARAVDSYFAAAQPVAAREA